MALVLRSFEDLCSSKSNIPEEKTRPSWAVKHLKATSDMNPDLVRNVYTRFNRIETLNLENYRGLSIYSPETLTNLQRLQTVHLPKINTKVKTANFLEKYKSFLIVIKPVFIAILKALASKACVKKVNINKLIFPVLIENHKHSNRNSSLFLLNVMIKYLRKGPGNYMTEKLWTRAINIVTN